MTAISMAEPRPSPSINLMSGLPRLSTVTSPASLSFQSSQGGAETTGFIDGRPAKRRKVSVSTPTTVNTKAVVVSSTGAIENKESVLQKISWIAAITPQINHGEETENEALRMLPLPERAWSSKLSDDTTTKDARPARRYRKDVAVPVSPSSMEIPLDAPMYEDKRRADYFPWTGKHQEDVLSDVHVKQGYFDRAPNPAEKELNTARTPLYNAFKHRSGLESLSALFGLVLEQKSNAGAYSSVSTLRGPPPRVTLTEAKRKSWISDLANPEVPLKRLSKTIPQGIRGQSLLEQCLQNSVPLSRSIWFAKCVGANEIRTLKRKGVNASVAQNVESKWLRDWTMNIQQFLEQLLSQCGQDKWKEKMHYSIQMVTRLFAEDMLDRDQYFDWILKSFSSSTPNHWPFWLMVVCLHRQDLAAYRKRGKQIAEILVTKYNYASHRTVDSIKPVVDRIRQVLRSFLFIRPACFLMPEKWSECEAALKSCLNPTDVAEQSLLQRLRRNNIRAMGDSQQQKTGDNNDLAHERIIECLDQASAPYDFQSLSRSLSETTSDSDVLVKSCVEWSISRYRSGLSRIYLVARLLRKWCRRGIDIDGPFFDSILKLNNQSSIDVAALRHLFSELTRSQSISVGVYLQWLTVRGLPSRTSFNPQSRINILEYHDGTSISIDSCTDVKQLLSEIALGCLNTPLVNLRHSLLQHAGFDVDNEQVVLLGCINYMEQRLKRPYEQPDKTRLNLAQLPWSIRTQLSQWLRNQSLLLARTAQHSTYGKADEHEQSLTTDSFAIIRDAIEQLQDITMMADVIRIVVFSKDEQLLAAVVDTIDRHSESLSAIGALEPLQKLYAEVYMTLRTVKTSMPWLATALINLCQQYHTTAIPIRALQQDFVRGDRGRAVAACSPYSDGVAESLQHAGATFHDDFEAILQTEFNMSEAVMTRLFGVLTERIEKLRYEGLATDNRALPLCQLLCRLRMCRKTFGETLMQKWLTKLLSVEAGEDTDIVEDIVTTGCAPIEMILDICKTSSVHQSWKTAIYGLVRSAVGSTSGFTSEGVLTYSVKTACLKLTRTRPLALLETLVLDNSEAGLLKNVDVSLINAVITIPDLIKGLSKPAWFVLSQRISEELGNFKSTMTLADQARALLDICTPLSLPFCQFRMRLLCQNVAAKTDEQVQEEISGAICASLANSSSALCKSSNTLQGMLRAAGPVIGTRVKVEAERAFLQGLPKFLQARPTASPPIPTTAELDAASSFLHRVMLVNHDHAASASTGAMASLIEKFNVYNKYLALATTISIPANNQNSPAASISSPVATLGTFNFSADSLRTFILETITTLEMLVQMTCIKRSSISAPSALSAQPTTPTTATTTPIIVNPASKHTSQDHIKLVVLLLTIATHPIWSTFLSASSNIEAQIPTIPSAQAKRITDVLDFMFDTASTLIDSVPDEIRSVYARLLKDKIRDPRARWVIGSVSMCGSVQWIDIGHGLKMASSQSKDPATQWRDFKPKAWDMLESGGGGGGGGVDSNDGCIGLGLFLAKKV